MNIIALNDEYREETERIAAGTWGSIHVAAHHELFDLRELPSFIAVSDAQRVIGYCYYRITNNECEIMAIESLVPKNGVGSALINTVVAVAKNESCKRIYVNTSNDNTHALCFYQRRGFAMCAVRWNEFDYLRTIKPTIPLTGDDDILLQHEIELEILMSTRESEKKKVRRFEYVDEKTKTDKQDDLSEALRSIESTLSKCEKALTKLREGTSQHTLTARRIDAFRIAVTLIKEKLEAIF